MSEEKVECERCGMDVNFITKATGTCLRCAVDESNLAEEYAIEEDDPEIAGACMKSCKSIIKELDKEGYGGHLGIDIDSIDELYNVEKDDKDD